MRLMIGGTAGGNESAELIGLATNHPAITRLWTPGCKSHAALDVKQEVVVVGDD